MKALAGHLVFALAAVADHLALLSKTFAGHLVFPLVAVADHLKLALVLDRQSTKIRWLIVKV